MIYLLWHRKSWQLNRRGSSNYSHRFGRWLAVPLSRRLWEEETVRRSADARIFAEQPRSVGNDINRSYKWFPWWLISAGRRFTWRGTMHDGSINRGGRRGREPVSSHLPICCSTSYLRGRFRWRAPTWTLMPLLSRVIIIPALWNTYCDPRDRYYNEKVSLSLSLGSQAEILWNPSRAESNRLAHQLCRKVRLLPATWLLRVQEAQSIIQQFEFLEFRVSPQSGEIWILRNLDRCHLIFRA